MNFRMNDLENFVEAAHCRTMSEAAQRLGITQPALSESIKRLEEDVAEVLLYRSRAGISLTPSGRAVLEKANSALSTLTEIESMKRTDTHFGSRIITIGCHSVVASYSLPKALKLLQQQAPDYRIDLKHDLSRTVMTEIQQGRVDVGLVVNPTPSPDLIITKIAEDDVGVWSTKKSAKDRTFCNLALMQTQSILRKWKHAPAIRVNTDSLELIVRLTAAGLGYGILPARAVSLVGADLYRENSLPVFKDSICLVYRPEFGKSQVERAVIAALRASLM